MNKFTNTIRLFIGTILLAVLLSSCDFLDFSSKDETYHGHTVFKFDQPELTLFAQDAQDQQKIGVSILKPSDKAQTFNFTVVDSSSAVEGEDYTLESKSVTVPAHAVLDSIPITLMKSSLADKPHLILQITSKDTAYNNHIVITLSQYFPYHQQEWVGDYDLRYPWFFGDNQPRTVSIVADPNNGHKLIAKSMLGGADITFNMDDSDPANFTVSFSQDSAWYSSKYGNVHLEGSGTFSADTYIINANGTHIVSVGSFGTYPFTLKKQ